MKSTGQELARLLAGKSSIEECSIQELEAFTNEYPWSAAHQLLLACKLKDQHPANYRKQLQKAAIFFNDPLWLDYLLYGESYTVTIPPPKEEKPTVPTVLPVSNSTGEAEKEEMNEVLIPDQNESVDEILRNESLEEVEISDETNAGLKDENNLIEEELPKEETIESVSIDHHAEITELTASESVQEESFATDEEIIKENSDSSSDNSGEPGLPALNLNLSEAEAVPLVFEPYHTVDYFASQGIKFVAEEKPSDKFGIQLKSFTEWLKTMKKLPQSGTETATEPEPDGKVDKMAEASLTDRDIWTEAMAEVWEKQGNPQKAMDIYQKLSLLEPAKTAYFARKIEKLKEQLK